jgi:hypothetical protein
MRQREAGDGCYQKHAIQHQLRSRIDRCGIRFVALVFVIRSDEGWLRFVEPSIPAMTAAIRSSPAEAAPEKSSAASVAIFEGRFSSLQAASKTRRRA